MLDIEDENVLKIIFKDNCTDSWRENPEIVQYLRELSSYGLERIGKEPEAVAEEKNAILEQTQDLVFNNYKTFIQTAECSKEVFQDFNLIEQHLDVVSTDLPQFIEKCKEFSKKSQEINTSRRLNSITLSKHPQLLEVLEMPQLMDTCVRNNYYDEALDLSAYVFRLEKKYSSIPIIQSITQDIQDSMKIMQSQLIQQLRTNIQLPVCLKVIGYLRRMDVFTEEELRIKFLQARDAWFQTILQNIPTADPYQHITKVIEVSRVHLFDIMTQYRAIFADDDPLLIGLKDTGENKAAICHGWVMQKVAQFLNMLHQDLQKEVGGRIESLLGQCMYFGLSFSRVGADFRSLLVPLFEKTVLRNFIKAISETSERFRTSMQSFILTSPPTMHVSSVLAATTAAQDKLHPPLCLLEFLPLVELCNNILTAFNDLRLLAPVSVFHDVTTTLQDCLCTAAKVIYDFYKAEENGLTSREEETFSKFCLYYAHELVPYLDRCLQVMFPQQQLAHILGISITEFHKLEYLGKLNINMILEPLLFILPQPENEVVSTTYEMTENVEIEVAVVETVSKTDDSPMCIEQVINHKSESAEINAKNDESEIILDANTTLIPKNNSVETNETATQENFETSS